MDDVAFGHSAGRMAMRGLSVAKYNVPRGVARPGRSLMSTNALLLQLTSQLADLITALPVNSAEDILQQNDMTAGLVGNPAAVSPDTAVSCCVSHSPQDTRTQRCMRKNYQS